MSDDRGTEVREYLGSLQDALCSAFERLDGARQFQRDRWERGGEAGAAAGALGGAVSAAAAPRHASRVSLCCSAPA